MMPELDRARTAVFSNVWHELRTPLTLMLGPLEDLLAGRHGPVAPEIHAQHELIHRNSLRLHKLVNAMLDFSRIEAGRTRATYQATDLAALTTDVAGMFRAAIERAGLALIVDCPPLPEPIFVDRAMWEDIVLNLLSNAFKFTFEGEIEVSLRHAGDAVALTVRDTGCGIPADELPRVFERFHRVTHARSRTHEGTGIGLALALELARLHGGTIDVASEPGAGTAFTVRIRTGRSHLPAEHIAPAPVDPAPRTPALANAHVEEALRWLPDASPPRDTEAAPGAARVLVADDSADMRDYLRRALAPHWQVTTAASGSAALDHIRRDPPDVVVSDVMMPGLDGVALIAALRADPATRHIPVIVVSARAGDGAPAEGLEAGADEYLVKPFSARELIARVRAQVAAVAARRELVAARQLAEAAAAKLARTVEYNEMFTAMLGHDLRNPLNAIATAAQLLQRRATVPEIARPATRIVLSTDRMSRMITQLLDLARVRLAGGLRLQPRPLDLSELCQLVLDELRQGHPGSHLELMATGSLHGRWDGDRLAQVISNLAGNALEHGDPRKPVHVQLDGRDPARVSIRVENRGEIPEDVLATVFEPFRGKHQRGENTRGLGLGLYISKEIVTAHRGRIEVRSSREDGTCFEIELPKHTEEVP